MTKPVPEPIVVLIGIMAFLAFWYCFSGVEHVAGCRLACRCSSLYAISVLALDTRYSPITKIGIRRRPARYLKKLPRRRLHNEGAVINSKRMANTLAITAVLASPPTNVVSSFTRRAK